MGHRVVSSYQSSILFGAALALLAVAPAFAQTPKGWMVRVDRTTRASDPDAAGSVKLVTSGSGLHATNPQAGVFWNPANTATGNYTLKATFTLLKSMGHSEYYGVIFGGSELDGPGQTYMYFMVAPDGSWLVKHRAGDSAVHTISERTPNDAVKQPDGSGKSTNTLEVRVMSDKVEFAVNGTVVNSVPKTAQGPKTDGIYGIRVNHMLEVQVDGLSVSNNRTTQSRWNPSSCVLRLLPPTTGIKRQLAMAFGKGGWREWHTMLAVSNEA